MVRGDLNRRLIRYGAARRDVKGRDDDTGRNGNAIPNRDDETSDRPTSAKTSLSPIRDDETKGASEIDPARTAEPLCPLPCQVPRVFEQVSHTL